MRAFACVHLCLAPGTAIVVTQGFGKLLTDDDVVRFRGPATIISTGQEVTLVNVGACEMVAIVVGAQPAQWLGPIEPPT